MDLKALGHWWCPGTAGSRWQPFVRGGPQERDRRGGTENVPGIVGMGAAAELAAAEVEQPEVLARVTALRDHLEREILLRIPDSHVNGDTQHRLANTTNIGFAGLEAEAILLLLSEQDISPAPVPPVPADRSNHHTFCAMRMPERHRPWCGAVLALETHHRERN